MAKRSNTTAKDIRSRIKHSNVHLGTGVELERISHSQLQQQRSAAGGTPLQSPFGQPGLHHSASASPAHQSEGTSYGFPSQESQGSGASSHLVSADAPGQFDGRQPQHGHPQSYRQYQPSAPSSLSAGHSRQASQQSFAFRPISPSADSASGYPRSMGDPENTPPPGPSTNSNAATPNRPQRSMRRPVGMSRPPSNLPPALETANQVPGLSVIPPPGDHPGGRPARSTRLMAQVNHLTSEKGRYTRQSQQVDEMDELDEGYGASSPIDGPRKPPFAEVSSQLSVATPPLGSLSKSNSPASLGSVLSALSEAGRKNQGRRIMRGMTAEEESRRRRVERKMDEARQIEFRDLSFYQQQNDDGGVGRIGAVHRKIKAEWHFVTEDDFNPVAMALSLLDQSSLGSNRGQFEHARKMIEQSLQGTVDDHYESFATAITLHNSVLSSLTNAQTSVSSSRRRLRDSREALGSKRADLVQLWQRQQSVKEALRLLHTVEQLRTIPDRLEALLSEKHFLTAVNLLMKALKAIEKPDIQEIGATADLRSYLRTQEGHILEILVEEIHSHLYLKSPYCDRRWSGYTPGEERLPDVKWGREYEAEDGSIKGKSRSSKLSDLDEREEGLARDGAEQSNDDVHSAPSSQTEVPVKLAKFLGGLSGRRTVDDADAFLGDLEAGGLDAMTSSAELGTRRTADDSGTAPLAATDPARDARGLQTSGPDEDEDGQAAAEFQDNPETDSFLYMEMLLEALARLGKLGVAMEAIHQRLAVEIHTLVEATIREVENRTEPLRRSSLAVLRPESVLLSSSTALAKTFGAGDSGRFSSYARSSNQMAFGAERHDSRPLSTLLRISSAESSQVESDGEVMRDLFWTLFSKLDAVLQGHRVVHEVASMITRRPGFKENSTVISGSAASIADKLRGRLVGGERLLDVWRPIQMEVRSLLHEYLMDDTQSPTARRNNVVSINDVLKKGTFNRDRSKKLFHIADRNTLRSSPSAASSSRPPTRLASGVTAGSSMALKRDWTPVKRHEENLDAALRASVPGLVSAADAQAAATGYSAARIAEQNILLNSEMSFSLHADRTNSLIESSHRLLVKPDAFNISVLFQPALAFVDRVRVVMPPEAAGETSKGFSAFLDEFVQDVFLPQLEEKVQTLFQGAAGGPAAFQEDTSARSAGYISKPIVKSATNIVVLIDSLYSMLRTTPFHRERYSRLIIQTIVQYYSRCHERFKELVSCPSDVGSDPASSAGMLMLSANWAQHPALSAVLSELKDIGSQASPRLLDLQHEEIQLEIQLAMRHRGETVQLTDLITSRKKLLALSHLEHSLKWLLTHISRFKATDENLPVVSKAAARLSVAGGIGRRDGVSDTDKTLKLPLSRDMASRFETLPRTYALLSDTILFTLRLELRARVIHHLDLAVSEGNYLVDESSAEPDPHVVDLNADFSNLDDILADCLRPDDHRFLFDGMANLMDTLLISSVRKIKALNRPGVSKMIRNILALQQNLKSIIISDTGGFAAAAVAAANDASEGSGMPQASAQPAGQQLSAIVSFDASRQFWELLLKSPDTMLRSVRAHQRRHKQQRAAPIKYGFEELKCALQLMLGLDNSPPTMSATAAGADDAKGATGSTSTPSGTAPLSVVKSTTGPSAPVLRPGTYSTGKGGVVSRQKLNEYLIELHQVLQEGED
ncbi:unnamed protein product [Parajaminaea phylloscopi]